MTGIILSNLIPSQILSNVLSLENKILFVYDNIYPLIDQKTPQFPIINVHDFIGDLWVFELDHAKTAMNIHSQICIHFWPQDLEWTYNGKDFISNLAIYRNVDNLYSYPDHQKPIENFCNRKPICKLKM